MKIWFLSKDGFEDERENLVSEIADQDNMLTKLRSMLQSDNIDMQNYKIMNSV